ncbi:MAG TPA: (2Fe-2S)-binding protein [Bacilli bacterium]
MRINEHPLLDFNKERKKIAFTFNDQPCFGYEGDTIASALVAAGFLKFRESTEKHRARGLYCAIGNCSSCHMIVNGEANVKTCLTLLEEGMKVEVQKDKGKI